MNKSDKAYFNAAKSISKLSDHKQHHVGCVLVEGHRIISSGYNSSYIFYPLQAKLDKEFFNDDHCLGPLHAETMALLPFIRRRINLKNCTLYVFRQHKDESFALARPCQRCMTLIQKTGLRRIKYTVEGDEQYIDENLRDLK